jgi:hypothetical protein
MMTIIYQHLYPFYFIIISYTIVAYFPISYSRTLTPHTVRFIRKHTDIYIF